MKILFLGDIVGNSGCTAIKKFLPDIIKSKKINFVIVNGENAAKEGVGITENIVHELLVCCHYNWKSCLGSKRNI